TLALVHGQVGIVDQGAGIAAVVGIERDAGAEALHEFALAGADRSREAFDDPLHRALGLAVAACVGEDDAELVATEAAHEVLRRQALADAPADASQQFVARAVAEAVVDRLEAIEVEERDREP